MMKPKRKHFSIGLFLIETQQNGKGSLPKSNTKRNWRMRSLRRKMKMRTVTMTKTGSRIA